MKDNVEIRELKDLKTYRYKRFERVLEVLIFQRRKLVSILLLQQQPKVQIQIGILRLKVSYLK